MAWRGLAIDHGRGAGTAAWLACIALAALAAWLLVQLAWQFVPGDGADSDARSVSATPVPVGTPPRSIASWHLFGDTPRAPGAEGETASTLALILRGTVADGDPQAGFAVIAGADGIERSYRIGQEVVPGVRLSAVHPDRVVLSRGGAEETLRLPRDGNLAPAEMVRATPAMASSRDARPVPGAPAAAPAMVARQTVTVSPEAQQTLARLQQDPGELLKRVQAVPVMDGGRLAGVRIAPGTDAALVGLFGLRTGDVVTAVDGQPIDSPARGQQILSSLAGSRATRVTVLRDGRPIEISVGLQ